MNSLSFKNGALGDEISSTSVSGKIFTAHIRGFKLTMKKTLFQIICLIFLLISTACQGLNESGAKSGSSGFVLEPGEIVKGNGTYFTVNEVGVGENGYVSLTNYTDVPAGLLGLYLCQGRDCFPLPDVIVESESTVRIAVGDGRGIEDVVATNATFGELRPTDGEIALLNSDDYDDPKAIAVYFQWGSNPHILTRTALEAGLWVEGGYGPTSDNATRLFKVEESGLWLFEE